MSYFLLVNLLSAVFEHLVAEIRQQRSKSRRPANVAAGGDTLD
jgi:hypothetical protein